MRAWERYRVLILVAVLAALWAAGSASGFFDGMDAAKVKRTVDQAGAWGMLLFVIAFALGELVHIPGMVFVGGGVLAYGTGVGFVVSLVAAIVSVSFSFLLVRAIGGRALAKVERPFMRKLLARLDQRPVTTVFVLRLVFWLAPPLNYALAMSNVRFRDYFTGSVLGLVPPVLIASMVIGVFV